ncbi:type II toxin-antitoxin system HicB family antitoxin [Alkalihalobacillus sp. MEB130]|uniref:type II toxin-antitoxin system HicB family antitoxin n=1 Tax=Alkalihalobacillus sp. MEB130 TaxID=2976704 RepID=UPI0028DFEF13|nr:type II toxin-antitoxin system HicB family antitoxin [Alkalihalobacillus sp. MEB130]MDT8859342.1 type II toxin-antitoxin system HicB family antitoxin [Alkalihalobacillus sp. MEB130]
MTTRENREVREYRPEDFTWRVREVKDWQGGIEMMIEIDQLDGCVSFGETVKDAKSGLRESLYLWLRTYGESQLPDVQGGAQLIYLDPPMEEEEFDYINRELQLLKG